MDGSIALLAALRRAARRPGDRQGVGALQAAATAAGSIAAAARESPHFILGLNFLVANQIDPAIDELTKAAAARRRPARDPPDPRQPVSREGPGRPRHPGAPGAAAAAEPAQARTRQRPAVPRPRLQARRLRRSRARGVHRRAAARSRQRVRAVEPREAVRGAAPVGRGLRDAPAAGRARRPGRRRRGTTRSSAFLENELGTAGAEADGLRRGGAPLRRRHRARCRTTRRRT